MEAMVSWADLEKEYRGKKVFVTGHTGFKGAWLLACLHLAGANIKGYALPPEYESGLYAMLAPMDGVESILADIRDKDRLKRELLSFEPNYVFHLAAQPLVRRSYDMPAETFDINVTGTANLLEAVAAYSKPCCVVVITTDKVYENKETNAFYAEHDALGGYDPYSASKACAELVVSAFRRSFFNPNAVERHGKSIASARAGNVIGGGDWSRDRLLPDIARSLLKEQPVEVRNPSSVRPWQHVLEPIGGYLMLGSLLRQAPDRYGRAYNFGPLAEDHLSVRELVEIAISTWGSGSWLENSAPGAPHEAGLLKLDISLAAKDLCWTPRLNARLAVQWALEWYRQPASRRAEYTFQQINSYFSA